MRRYAWGKAQHLSLDDVVAATNRGITHDRGDELQRRGRNPHFRPDRLSQRDGEGHRSCSGVALRHRRRVLQQDRNLIVRNRPEPLSISDRNDIPDRVDAIRQVHEEAFEGFQIGVAIERHRDGLTGAVGHNDVISIEGQAAARRDIVKAGDRRRIVRRREVDRHVVDRRGIQTHREHQRLRARITFEATHIGNRDEGVIVLNPAESSVVSDRRVGRIRQANEELLERFGGNVAVDFDRDDPRQFARSERHSARRLNEIATRFRRIRFGRELHRDRFGRSPIQQNREVEERRGGVAFDQDHVGNRESVRLNLERSDIRSRVRRSDTAPLVDRLATRVVASVDGRRAFEQSMRLRRAPVIGQRSKDGIERARRRAHLIAQQEIHQSGRRACVSDEVRSSRNEHSTDVAIRLPRDIARDNRVANRNLSAQHIDDATTKTVGRVEHRRHVRQISNGRDSRRDCRSQVRCVEDAATRSPGRVPRNRRVQQRHEIRVVDRSALHTGTVARQRRGSDIDLAGRTAADRVVVDRSASRCRAVPVKGRIDNRHRALIEQSAALRVRVIHQHVNVGQRDRALVEQAAALQPRFVVGDRDVGQRRRSDQRHIRDGRMNRCRCAIDAPRNRERRDAPNSRDRRHANSLAVDRHIKRNLRREDRRIHHSHRRIGRSQSDNQRATN